MITITIRDYLKDDFYDKFNKMSRRWPGADLKIESLIPFTKLHSKTISPYAPPITVRKKYYDITVSSLADHMQIEGYDFLGGIHLKDGVPIIFNRYENTPLNSMVDLSFNFRCVHCGKIIIQRNHKLFFRNLFNDSIVSFGTNCAKRYFGEDILSNLERSMILMDSLFDSDILEHSSHEGYSFYFEVMFYSIAMFKNNATFISQGKADSLGCMSSSATIMEYITAKYEHLDSVDNEIIQSFEANHPINFSFQDELEKIITYYEDKQVVSDFDFNVKNQICMTGNRIGLLVYGVYAYYRTLREEFEKSLVKNDKLVFEWHPASIKDRIEIDSAELVTIRPYSSMYGNGVIYEFVSGPYCFITFGTISSFKRSDTFDSSVLKEGECFNMKMTIKDKKDYKGVQQTVVRNVKVRHIS
jgi:hypothetical protein